VCVCVCVGGVAPPWLIIHLTHLPCLSHLWLIKSSPTSIRIPAYHPLFARSLFVLPCQYHCWLMCTSIILWFYSKVINPTLACPDPVSPLNPPQPGDLLPPACPSVLLVPACRPVTLHMTYLLYISMSLSLHLFPVNMIANRDIVNQIKVCKN